MVVRIRATVDGSKLSAFTIDEVHSIAEQSGNTDAEITDAGRTPYDEAVAIHDNCVHHGTAYQRELYTDHSVPGHPRPLPGCKVIDVFETSVHLSRADTIAAMTAKIVELGPEHVSHHCCDPAVLQVVDIGYSSLAHTAAFKAEAIRRGWKCLDEPRNGCLHVEIQQPARIPIPQPALPLAAPVGA